MTEPVIHEFIITVISYLQNLVKEYWLHDFVHSTFLRNETVIFFSIYEIERFQL